MTNEDLAALEGVGPAMSSKLRSAGLTNVETVVVTPPKEIAEKTGIGFNTVLKIVASARKMLNIGFITANELWEKRKNMVTKTVECAEKS